MDELIEIMLQHKLSLSTAESCTGGRIASRFTAISGASKYYFGGLVAYQSELKTHYLGVDQELIDKYDVVSEQVVVKMGEGACKMFNSDYAVATTGYAGPTGGTESIPVGTIWIAAGNKDNTLTKCLHFDGSREDNLNATVDQCVSLLLHRIKKDYIY